MVLQHFSKLSNLSYLQTLSVTSFWSTYNLNIREWVTYPCEFVRDLAIAMGVKRFCHKLNICSSDYGFACAWRMPASKRKSYCKPSISWLFCPIKIWNEQNHEAKKWNYFTRVSAFYRLASQLHRTKISSQIVLPDNSFYISTWCH